MFNLLTAEQMRATERVAIESGAVTGLQLMERAGAGVVSAIMKEWPDFETGVYRVAILCGPGNNGGDGYVIARLLKERGWDVDVFVLGDVEKLPTDAKANYRIWSGMGGISPVGSKRGVRSIISTGYHLVVDALFGTGLVRPISDNLGELMERPVGDKRFKLVCVDIASGVCADSGQIIAGCDGRENAVGPADLTVTFHRAKPGHILAEGSRLTGKLRVVDIGLADKLSEVSRDLNISASLAGDTRWFVSYSSDNGKLRRDKIMQVHKVYRTAHKYDYGHALVVAGSMESSGAARLAARGALRMGSGLVSIVCDESSVATHATQLNAIMIKQAEDGNEFRDLLRDKRLNAICLGPGLGYEKAREFVPIALASGCKVVLDADSLVAYEDDPGQLFAMLHSQCVLTPHAGEFARLFPDIANQLDNKRSSCPVYSRVNATLDAAKRAGAIVLLKGSNTIIADLSNQIWISSASKAEFAPWLATAGAGDILAGFIIGLLARGFAPLQAAELAAWLHVECACSFGPGLIAEDISEQLPVVLRA